ncbi:hypothetical protein [Halocalculus aciditolerans]|uniref:Uncharacterized protein n=1 Tax=Halocalculus aciditolerans TaxID=1383812 RepID=A0A830FH69_9EURY|nr:hypothetical protein [Halocalculus aciditolerans]GGL54984.1 hypothetical protein GCM10009039_11350 [Halocalculus aciditolerans]
MSDGSDLFVRDLDETLYSFLDADNRTKKEAVETALTREYGGERKQAIDVRIEQKDRRIDLLQQEISELQAELDREKNEREALVDRRQELDNERTYEDDLRALFEEFAESRAVLPRFRSDARDIAEEHGETLATIEQDLRHLADEEDVEIDADRWTDDYGEGL